VRAAIARLPLLDGKLGTPSPPDPQTLALDDKVRRRCETDSIWEGRQASLRWLIEFVGITQDKHGVPRQRVPNPALHDVAITDFAGGTFVPITSPEAAILAAAWRGVTRASGHASRDYQHPDVSEAALSQALDLVLTHLQSTIYDTAGLKLVLLALTPA
jgi:hypothetical protein